MQTLLGDSCFLAALLLGGRRTGNDLFDLFGRQEGRVSEIREESAGRLVFIEDETRAEVPERLEWTARPTPST